MAAMTRFLLSLLTMACLVAGTGCLATPTSHMPESQARAEIEKLGGQVTVDKASPELVIAVNLSDVAISDAALACLDAFPHLHRLDLGHTKKLDPSTVTDAGLAHLQGLTELRRLSLTNANVTDAGLVYLKGLTHLQSLNLDGTKVTDAGIARLTGLSGLQTLKLRDTEVTDAGVMSLGVLSQLQNLNLEGTAVTPAAVRMFRRALPDCQISH